MREIRVGIIGAGGISQAAHIPSFQKVPGVKLVGISDVNRKKLKSVADKFQIPYTFTEWKKLLEIDLDAVSICSPNVFHAEQAITALKSGRHVLCEKPICLKSRDVPRIYQAARQAGKKFMGAFPRRFSGEAKVLKPLVKNGEFGEIYYVKTGYLRRRGIPGLGSWFTNKKLAGGGPMMDIGVHALDFVIYLLGGPLPKTIMAVTYDKLKDWAIDGGWPPPDTRLGDKNTGPLNVEDFAAGFIKLTNGATLLIEASWAGNLAPHSYTTILGTKAGVQMPDPADVSRPIKIFSERNGILTDTTPVLPQADVFQEEINHFVDCIRRDKPPITRQEEILSVVEIIEGIYQSANSGRPVLVK